MISGKKTNKKYRNFISTSTLVLIMSHSLYVNPVCGYSKLLLDKLDYIAHVVFTIPECFSWNWTYGFSSVLATSIQYIVTKSCGKYCLYSVQMYGVFCFVREPLIHTFRMTRYWSVKNSSLQIYPKQHIHSLTLLYDEFMIYKNFKGLYNFQLPIQIL